MKLSNIVEPEFRLKSAADVYAHHSRDQPVGRKTFCGLSPFYQRLFLTGSSATTKHAKFTRHSTRPRPGILCSALGWGHSPLHMELCLPRWEKNLGI